MLALMGNVPAISLGGLPVAFSSVVADLSLRNSGSVSLGLYCISCGSHHGAW